MPAQTASAPNSDGSLNGFIDMEKKKRVPQEADSSSTPPNGQYSQINDASTGPYDKVASDSDSSLTKEVDIAIVSPMTEMQIMKNLAIICTTFFLLYTAFHSMMNLQSSLNKEEGVGTFALFLSCLSTLFSSLFLAPVCIDRLGQKRTICFAMVPITAYMAATLYPVWGTMVTTAILCGVVGGPFWAAQSSYVSVLAGYYSRITNTKLKDTLSYFFGIFYMCVNASKISGNLLASVLLKQDDNTNRTMTPKEIEDCVANIQEAVDNATTLERPDDTTIYTICGTWIGLGIAGLIVLLFLTPVSADGDNFKKRKRTSICSNFLATAKHYWNSRLQKILIPVTLYYGILNGFVVADFTRSIVGCTVGIQAVGEVMLCHGVCNTIAAALIGRLVKNFGQLPFFTFTFLSFGVVEVLLLVWKPGPEYFYLFFILAGLFGVGDAILKTQVIAIYGHLFEDNKDAAFGAYFMLEASGYITAMAYSTFVSTDIKLYILLILLVLSVISYYTVEYLDRKNNRHKDADRQKA